MSIYEYDEEKHMQQERNDAREDGIQEGLQQGRLQQVIFQICRKLRKGKSVIHLQHSLYLFRNSD